MRRSLSIWLLLLVCPCIYGQEDVAYKLKLDQVDIKKQRHLKNLGTTKTDIDTMVLRESVVNSLADILSQNTSIFIKNYGRGTMATASFRGTAPSHTQVLWNGMKVNSPMLGQVDFSLIPSYFIDDMQLWHGASSVNVAGGGLGGAITLGNKPVTTEGLSLYAIQGVSSFSTYDEFLHLRFAKNRFQTSTRFYYADSKNDFEYINYNKIKFHDDGTGSHPTEKNKNGDYRDLHILQELYYDIKNGNKLSLSAWYMNSKRGIPLLDVNYNEKKPSSSRQDQTTLRTVGSWERYSDMLKISARAGYTYDDMLYTFRNMTGTDQPSELIHSNSVVHTGFIQLAADYFLSGKWMLSVNSSVNLQSVDCYDRIKKTGYEKERTEASAFASLRYRPISRIGFALDIREEYYGSFTPAIPAAFIDIVLWPRHQVVLKSSVAGNYRYPSLNDLYFLPGGNPDLKAEQGITYDGGIEFTIKKKKSFSFSGEVSAFNSKIKNWIVWLPSFKGFWEPKNVKQVHSYGWEVKGKSKIRCDNWTFYLDGNWAQTRAINEGDPVNWADESIGKQLVYIPEYSFAATGRIEWRDFWFTYKYNYFSERFTTSSNETHNRIGRLAPYYMNDIVLEKRISLKPVDLSLKINIYNLFDETYISVLNHPMPGRNYGFFIGIKPKW